MHTVTLGYGLTTIEAAEARQDELIADGSTLAEIGKCGEETLPCGVCTECEEAEVG